MSIPTPPSAPTPVTPGVELQIDGPTDLGAKIVKHLAEKHVGEQEEETLRPLDVSVPGPSFQVWLVLWLRLVRLVRVW